MRRAALSGFFELLFPSIAFAASAPVTVSFDFSRHAIELTATVKGKPINVLLDTGVNPSVIDLGRATALGLPLYLIVATASASSCQGKDGCARMIFRSGKSAATSSTHIGLE